MIVYRITKIVYRITKIVYRITKIVYRITKIVYCITKIVYRITKIVYRITKIVLMQYMYSHEEFLNYVKNISSKKLKKFVESMFYVHVGLMCAQMSLDKNNLVIISNACNKLL